MEPVISIEHVDAGYPGAVILRDVSFEVFRGEVFILLGGSGCGKSTIMKHMIGLNPVLAGRLTVAGMEWTEANRAALCRKIGVMYQSGALFGSMTCIENVMLPLEEFTPMKRPERIERARSLLADVELADAALEAMPDGADKLDRLIAARLKDPGDRDEVRKLSASLYRRGFSAEEIRSALRRVQADFEEY